MSRAYQLTEAAKRHVDEIGAFIAEDSVDAALKVYDELEKAFGLLGDNPGLGHARQDLTDKPLKFWNVYSYLVVYNPHDRPVTIIAVIHAARDVPRILKAE